MNLMKKKVFKSETRNNLKTVKKAIRLFASVCSINTTSFNMKNTHGTQNKSGFLLLKYNFIKVSPALGKLAAVSAKSSST